MVYVFRAYPVVAIVANVIPLTKELKITDTSFKFKVCWSLQSKYELPNDTGIFLFTGLLMSTIKILLSGFVDFMSVHSLATAAMNQKTIFSF